APRVPSAPPAKRSRWPGGAPRSSCDARGGDMKVCLDATPLLGVRTGIGRYTEHLLRALTELPDVEDIQPAATAFTLRGGGRQLAAAVPGGVPTRSLPVPARALRAAWA